MTVQNPTVQCPRCLEKVEGYVRGFDKEGNPNYHAHFLNGDWRAVES